MFLLVEYWDLVSLLIEHISHFKDMDHYIYSVESLGKYGESSCCSKSNKIENLTLFIIKILSYQELFHFLSKRVISLICCLILIFVSIVNFLTHICHQQSLS